MQWNFPYHQRYCQHDHNGRYEPVLFGDGRHTENERGQRRYQRRCRQQLRHLGHKNLAGGWWYCRHSGSGRLGSFGPDSGRGGRHRPAAWHGGQSRRRHGVSQNGFQQHRPEHRRLHGRKRLVGYQPLYHRADRHFAQHLRWNVAWNIGHHQPAGEPRHNGHPRHGPYSAGGTVQ